MRFRLSATILVVTVLALGGVADGQVPDRVRRRDRQALGIGPPARCPGLPRGNRHQSTAERRHREHRGYTLPLLPIGDYKVEVALSGFETVTSKLSVYTGRNTQFDVNLKLSSVAASVAVTGEQPVVDKGIGRRWGRRSTRPSPEAARRAAVPGRPSRWPRASPGANPNVRGALSGNNVFLFDGVDTTDTTTGTFGRTQQRGNQEIAINTGGYSAEYGRASGAIVSVVTKSGTNDFPRLGEADLQQRRVERRQQGLNEVTGVVTNRNKYDEVQYRYSGTLGGPVIKDNLWFFGAYEYAPTTTPETQTVITNEGLPADDEDPALAGQGELAGHAEPRRRGLGQRRPVRRDRPERLLGCEPHRRARSLTAQEAGRLELPRLLQRHHHAEPLARGDRRHRDEPGRRRPVRDEPDAPLLQVQRRELPGDRPRRLHFDLARASSLQWRHLHQPSTSDARRTSPSTSTRRCSRATTRSRAASTTRTSARTRSSPTPATRSTTT